MTASRATGGFRARMRAKRAVVATRSQRAAARDLTALFKALDAYADALERRALHVSLGFDS